jgi:hypothetical protein
MKILLAFSLIFWSHLTFADEPIESHRIAPNFHALVMNAGVGCAYSSDQSVNFRGEVYGSDKLSLRSLKIEIYPVTEDSSLQRVRLVGSTQTLINAVEVVFDASIENVNALKADWTVNPKKSHFWITVEATCTSERVKLVKNYSVIRM